MDKPKKINISILTPTTVGSGEKMTAYTDYFIRDRQAIYVEHDLVRRRLQTLLPTHPTIVSDYMAEITDRMNQAGNKSEARLTDFLENRLGLPLNSFAEKYPFGGFNSNDDKIQIYKTVRNARQPYLPGSSIKGALITAILHDWLLNAPKGNETLKNIADDIDLTHAAQKSALALEEQMFAEGRKKKNDFERQLLDNRKKAVKELDGRIEKQFENLFGRLSKEKRMDFSALRAGDSSLFAEADLVVQAVKRLNFRDGSFGIPQLRECLRPGAPGGYCTLQIMQYQPGFKEAPWLNTPDALSRLFKVVNRFSSENLKHDQTQYDSYLAHHPDAPAQQKNLSRFFADQIAFLEKAPDNICRLRVGAGKTYFYNSIGLALRVRHAHAFEAMAHLFGLGNPGQKRFPVTRVLTDPGFEPTGWIEFSF